MKRRLSVSNLSSENNLATFRLNATFALMITGAFSQNIGKLFSELKLVPDNLLYTMVMTQSSHVYTHDLHECMCSKMSSQDDWDYSSLNT